MFNVRFHGRGGQGAATAAAMLSVAAFDAGKHAQAFPTFGSERTGAPVVSFCRIDERPIRTHEPVSAPDALVVLDPTLLHQVRLFDGVGPRAFVLLNTSRTFSELGLDELARESGEDRWATVPASELAGKRRLGSPCCGGIVRASTLLRWITGPVARRFRRVEHGSPVIAVG